jgi:hypothetical protein
MHLVDPAALGRQRLSRYVGPAIAHADIRHRIVVVELITAGR